MKYASSRRQKRLSFAIAALATSQAASSFAQQAVEEITVSARRKVEVAQDVPITLTVVGGDKLEATGTFNVARMTEQLPSLQLYSSNPRNTSINIRGLGAPFGLTNDGIEPGVGVYVDQVYNSRPASTTFDFIDVQQVEVLNGPQGTLYGKNTTAGAINVTTRAPSFTAESKLEASSGNIGFSQLRGFVTGPLSERVAGRVSFSRTTRDGTVLNIRNGERYNDLDNLGVRTQLLWDATDDFTLTLNADFNEQRTACCTQVIAGIAITQRPANRQFGQMAAELGYTPPGTNAFARITDIDTPIKGDQDLGGIGLVAELKLGAATLTSVTGWRFWYWYPGNDRDFTGLPVTTVSANPSRQTQWTQEFRFSTRVNEKFDYVAGLFLYDQEIHSLGVQEQGSAAARWLLAPSSAASTPGLLNGLRQDNDIRFDNQSYALFGQATWAVTDRLRVIPGIRLNHDAKHTDYQSVVSGGLATDNPALIALKNSVLQSQSYIADSSDTDVSGQLTIAYDIADNVQSYATWSKAFKSVGVNLSGIPNDASGKPALTAATVKPETVRHLEFGIKSRWLEELLTVNANVFRTQIDDFQANVVNGAVGVLRGYLANAKSASVSGLELALDYKPTDSLSLTLNAAFNDGTYDDFKDAPCPLELTGAGTGVCDVSGTRLPGLSDTVVASSAEYVQPLPLVGSDSEWFAALEASYRSDFSSSATASRLLVVPAYTLTNARVGVRSYRDHKWELFAWGRNVFDIDFYEFMSAQAGGSGLYVAEVGDPRTFGVTFNYSF